MKYCSQLRYKGGKWVKRKRTQKKGERVKRKRTFLVKRSKEMIGKKVSQNNESWFLFQGGTKRGTNKCSSLFLHPSIQTMNVSARNHFYSHSFSLDTFQTHLFPLFFPFFLSLTYTSIPFFLLVCNLFFSIGSLQHKKVHTARAI